jgi:hypothetical protein
VEPQPRVRATATLTRPSPPWMERQAESPIAPAMATTTSDRVRRVHSSAKKGSASLHRRTPKGPSESVAHRAGEAVSRVAPGDRSSGSRPGTSAATGDPPRHTLEVCVAHDCEEPFARYGIEECTLVNFDVRPGALTASQLRRSVACKTACGETPCQRCSQIPTSRLLAGDSQRRRSRLLPSAPFVRRKANTLLESPTERTL